MLNKELSLQASFEQPELSRQLVFLNGEYIALCDARVSVMDRGFLFGDGVYEVIPVVGDKLLRQQDHFLRLQNSLDRISLKNPLAIEQWQEIFSRLLAENKNDSRAIYLQISRGVYPLRDLAIKPEEISADFPATVFVMVLPVKQVDLSVVSAGIKAITIEDFRWDACDIKSTSLVANVMLRQQATEADVDDAILIKHGYVTEGTASNLFLVVAESLITPPTGHQLLSGITRELVIDLAKDHGIEVIQRPVTQAELFTADEIWLTSSTREIAPVIQLDEHVVSGGQAGPLWHRMTQWYQQNKQVLKHHE